MIIDNKITTGGQNGWAPLHRNAPYDEGCASVDEDPNAPVLYFLGTGFEMLGVTLLWESGELATSEGVSIPPLNKRIVVEGYNTWDPYDEQEGYDLERWMQVLPTFAAGYFTIDGQKSRVERAAALVRIVDGFSVEPDGFWLFTGRGIEPQISGIATLDDASNVTFTGTGGGGVNSYYQLTFDGDLTGRSVVSVEIDEGPEKLRVFIGADHMTGGEQE